MPAIVGGIIAVILLGIYIRLIVAGSVIIHCATHTCVPQPFAFNDEMTFALSTISGLVSALVISQLAIAKPGESPGVALLGASPTARAVATVRIVSWSYVLAWLVSGCWIFMITMYHPTTLPTLTTLAHAWLGLAVAAGYAYFGLQR
jgi:hypothetical protein